jgi:hypothetical protein
VQELRVRTRGTWLQDLATSDLLDEFTDREQFVLLLQLWLVEAPVIEGDGDELPPPVDPAAALSRLAEWWVKNREAWTAAYEERIYPDGERPDVGPDFSPDDVDAREEWLALLTHGALHQLGRTRPQADRNFVAMWRDRGWLRTFADEQTLPEYATSVLDEFLEGTFDWIPYFHWMRQYPAVYLLAKGLGDYVGAFLALDQHPTLRSLGEVLMLRTSAVMGGGGYDAPPIGQALGIGASFVVRELARFGVLRGRQVHPHCFVPYRRVRALLQNGFGVPEIAAGYEGSRQIHGFLADHLDDPTFGGSFDLPLLALAEDPGLQQQFLYGEVSTELPDAEPDEDELL